MRLQCAVCGDPFDKRNGDYNQQVKRGQTVFVCSRSCGARRTNSRRRGKVRTSQIQWNEKALTKPLVSYLIGLGASDGSVHVRETYVHTVSFYSTDKHIIEDLTSRLEYDRDVKLNRKSHKTRKGKDSKVCWMQTFYSEKARFWVEQGLSTEKETQDLPEGVDLFKFLLGLMDGDGGLNEENRQVVFLAYPRLINQIQQTLAEQGFLGWRGKDGVLDILAVQRDHTPRLLELMYEDAPLFLKRKREQYERWKNEPVL
jgi:hypothetical protein